MSGMIKPICNIFLLLVLTFHLYAQKGNKVVVVYKTAIEFSSAKPSLILACNSKNKILLNDFFNKSYITIKQGDSSYQLFKKSIYGYQTCNSQVFRFFNKKELLLLNKEEKILIYKHLVSKPPTGRTNVTNYYFSFGKEGEVQKLTFKNLKSRFKNNPDFLDLINNAFKYNTDLATFDDIHKTYAVNLLLNKSEN